MHPLARDPRGERVEQSTSSGNQCRDSFETTAEPVLGPRIKVRGRKAHSPGPDPRAGVTRKVGLPFLVSSFRPLGC